MAGRFTQIPENTFDALQLDAGMLLKRFNPAAPNVQDDDIICATTGGINPVCQPTYSDFGEDVDNVPNNMMEFKHLDGWDCSISTTGLGTSAELIKMALGAADIDLTDTGKIIPRQQVALTDFTDIWWVGDKANGGFVAIRLMNALSTAGFSLQTTKNGKGQVALTITGHVSISAQSVVPMEFYSYDEIPDDYFTIKTNLINVTSDLTSNTVAANAELEVNLTAETGYTLENVIVTMGGVDVTDADYSAGTITISAVTGNVEIIATANVTG